MSYRTGSCFYIPTRKIELIEEIIKSKKWLGTKQALKDMPTKQIRAIFIKFRNEMYTNAFKKQSESSALKDSNNTEV